MADKRISQLIERTDIANNDVLPIVASGATTTNKVTISTIQDWMQENLDVGVTSVGLSMPSAFTVTNSPVTTSGNISVAGAGTVSQYIRGDGSLADFPSISGGGSSVSYYLNGSVSQGTIGGVAYTELSKVPILGAGTDFTINADGYIASFITDAGDPSLLEIPGGNWNFETYFQASSGGGSPTFYVELYKVSGSTATLIATSSGSPELIAFGTNITPYFSTLAVPTTTLALTDRLAIRYYVTHSGRTITLHTENNTLCQIITTFTTGLTALNGLTAQVQNFATGTSGTDFNISSSGTTHTFNIPSASATARGLVTTGSQTFAGTKTFAVDAVINGVSVGRGGGNLTTNTVVGRNAFISNTGGNNNTSVGDATLLSNTTGNDNTALGFTSLRLNTTGNNNTSVGSQSMFSNTSGNHNTATGSFSCYNTTTGLQNSAFGSFSLTANSTGSDNTAVGFNALTNNTTASGNTGVGLSALQSNTTGNANTATGAYALENNTTGSNNTAVGQEALENNIVGTFNTAVGHQALKSNTNSSNTAIGYLASSQNSSGTANFSGGARALENNTTGSVNTSIGFASLQTNTTGGGNVAIGEDAGRYISTGTGNTNGGDSVFIGRQTKPLGDSQTNQIVIGHNAIGNGSNTVTIGNSSITNNYFTGNIRGGAFIRTGGTSSQFLKADGSVDSSTYLTTGSAASTYLPLVGGTLTGTLEIGTSAPSIFMRGSNGNVKSIQFANAGGSLHWSLQTALGVSGEQGTFSIRNNGLTNDAIVIQPSSNNISLTGALNGTSASFTGALSGTSAGFSSDVQTSTRFIAAKPAGEIRITPDLSGTTNRIESLGSLPFSLTSVGAITLAAGGTTPQITLATSGAATFSSSVGIGAAPTGTYGTLSVSGGVSIKNDNSAKLEIGRYSAGVPNSYIKLGPSSNSLRVTNNTDAADIFVIENGGNVGIGNTNPFNGATSLRGIALSDRAALFQLNVNNHTYLTSNLYYDGTDWRRIVASGGSFLQLSDASGGELKVFGTASGAAGSAASMIQRLEINSSGSVIVGASYMTYPVSIEAQSGGGQLALTRSGAVAEFYMGGTTGGGTQLFVRSGGSGGVRLDAGSTGWVSASDIRLKDIEKPIENAVESLSTLQTVYYSWKDSEDKSLHLGLIAQEVEDVFPEIVSESSIDEMKGVNYTELIPVLIKAIQELKTEIDSLKNQIK